MVLLCFIGIEYLIYDRVCCSVNFSSWQMFWISLSDDLFENSWISVRSVGYIGANAPDTNKPGHQLDKTSKWKCCKAWSISDISKSWIASRIKWKRGKCLDKTHAAHSPRHSLSIPCTKYVLFSVCRKLSILSYYASVPFDASQRPKISLCASFFVNFRAMLLSYFYVFLCAARWICALHLVHAPTEFVCRSIVYTIRRMHAQYAWDIRQFHIIFVNCMQTLVNAYWNGIALEIILPIQLIARQNGQIQWTCHQSCSISSAIRNRLLYYSESARKELQIRLQSLMRERDQW